MEKQDRACTAFHIINSILLTSHAVENIFDNLQSKISEFNKTSKLSNLLTRLPADNPLRKDFCEAISIIKYADNVIALHKEASSDIKQANADLFNIKACNYIEVVTDRRKIWLDNSRIRLYVQRELNSLPIDIFFGDLRCKGY